MMGPVQVRRARHKPMLSLLACVGFVAPIVLAAGPSYALSAQQAAAKYGTRAPAKCPEVQAVTGNPPSAAIAEMLVKCHYETESIRTILLLDDVTVQLGGAIPYSLTRMARDADPRFPEYPVRGSFTQVTCGQNYASLNGKNCLINKVTEDTGLCWRSTFNDWECGFGGGDAKSDGFVTEQPPTAGTIAQ